MVSYVDPKKNIDENHCELDSLLSELVLQMSELGSLSSFAILDFPFVYDTLSFTMARPPGGL